MENEVVSEAGDFLFVPPGVLHEAIKLERHRARARGRGAQRSGRAGQG